MTVAMVVLDVGGVLPVCHGHDVGGVELALYAAHVGPTADDRGASNCRLRRFGPLRAIRGTACPHRSPDGPGKPNGYPIDEPS